MCMYVHTCICVTSKYVFMYMDKRTTIWEDLHISALLIIDVFIYVLFFPCSAFLNNLGIICIEANKPCVGAPFTRFYILHVNEIYYSLLKSTVYEFYITWQ